MDTAVTIIGLVITALIGIPLYFVFRASKLDKAKITKLLKQYKNYHFYISDKLNKKALYLDATQKGFLLVNFSTAPETASFIDLKQMASCSLSETTKANAPTIVQIDFAFHPKDGTKPVLVPFYKMEHDQLGQVCLYEDRQLAKKWQRFLEDSIAA